MSVLEIDEGETPSYTATVQDSDGNALAAADLDTLTLTLYDKSTGDIINSRNAQNALNANQVTVSSAGALEWIMTTDDTAIQGTNTHELHVSLFIWTWTSGGRTLTGHDETEWLVRNVTKV